MKTAEKSKDIAKPKTGWHKGRGLKEAIAFGFARAVVPALFALTLMFAQRPGAAFGQEFSGLSDVDALDISYHRFVRPGEPRIQVLILGNTTATGMYVIGETTDFAELFALTGATTGGDSWREKTRVNVRLYRNESETRSLTAEADLEHILTNPMEFPSLMDGDIIIVESRSSSKVLWYDVLHSASSIATLAFVVERVLRVLL